MFYLSGIYYFHSFGPKLDIVSVTKCAVCVFLLAKCIPLLKLKLSFSWKLKTSFIIIGDRPFLTLKISVAKYGKIFIWTETELSFCNNSSKIDCLSWKTVLKALRCMLLIPYLKFYYGTSKITKIGSYKRFEQNMVLIW